MSVQNRTGAKFANDGYVQQRFRGRATSAANHVGCAVHFQKTAAKQRPLVEAGGSDGESQRIAGKDTAEISAGSENPAPRVEGPTQIGEFLSEPSEVAFAARASGAGRRVSFL